MCQCQFKRVCETARNRVEGRSERLRDQSSDGNKGKEQAKMTAKTQWDPN